jgi:Kef-type K+ transport system membrane component KefB
VPYDNLLIVVAVAAAVPLILGQFPRPPVPGPVLEIVAGVVLGPSALNLVQPDTTVLAFSTLGLGFLLFLSGLEIDIQHFRGQRAKQAGLALAATVVLASIMGELLFIAGLVENPLLIGITLVASSVGVVVPILKDAGVVDRPAGQLTIAGASVGEVSGVVLLSLFFSEQSTTAGTRLVLLLGLVALVALVVVATMRAEHWLRIRQVVTALADTSAQLRVRLSMLLVVGLSALALHLGFEAILGTFFAGGALRLVDPDAERTHPLFHVKIEGLGFGFLIPVFFVTSGIQFNLGALFADASTVLRVPIFLAALLVVRGLPALVYRASGLVGTEVVASGLLQATSLPLIVAATTICVQLHALVPANGAALLAAGILSVVIFPAMALPLLRATTSRRGAP